MIIISLKQHISQIYLLPDLMLADEKEEDRMLSRMCLVGSGVDHRGSEDPGWHRLL